MGLVADRGQWPTLESSEARRESVQMNHIQSQERDS